MSLTSGSTMTSLTDAVSFDGASVYGFSDVMSYSVYGFSHVVFEYEVYGFSNLMSPGGQSLTVFGSGFGVTRFSGQGRIGQSVCEG